MTEPKVALIHDYLVQYGGAEKTLEAIMELFPAAPIYTGVYKPKLLSSQINSRKIICPNNSLLNMFPKHLTFLMPTVFESFDLREYDIIISDGTAWPKGVLTTPQQLHISYVHTPPRFLYKYSVESSVRNSLIYKPFVSYLDHYLRMWDFSAAQRPDYLLANSQEIRKRIQKFYKRDAKVIYPPVEIDFPTKFDTDQNFAEPYYLSVGRLSAYKNLDILVQAFNLLGMHLTIAGTGIEEPKLKKMAKPNIKFLGRVSELEKHQLYANCLGLIFPVVDEDLGIVPIEAMAHGKPVLAHRSGGVLETVQEGFSGMFFDTVTVESLIEKIKEFDTAIRAKKFNPEQIKQTTQNYGKERFKKEFSSFVREKWEEHNARTTGSTNNNL